MSLANSRPRSFTGVCPHDSNHQMGLMGLNGFHGLRPHIVVGSIGLCLPVRHRRIHHGDHQPETLNRVDVRSILVIMCHFTFVTGGYTFLRRLFILFLIAVNPPVRLHVRGQLIRGPVGF